MKNHKDQVITIIKSVDVYTPDFIGNKDVAFCHNQLLSIEDTIDINANNVDIVEIDGTGKFLMPGIIDPLVHISGGGGEGGFQTRTPGMQLTDATSAGVTTVIGALGTDDVSRSLEDLLACACGLENEGLSVYCHTGSYQVPVQTVTGSVRKDIMLLSNVIGVGELAIADHRSSHPSVAEIVRIASDARVGGMLSGKKGCVFLHVGDDKSELSLIHGAVETSAIPMSQFYATHINRTPSLLTAGIEFAKQGGFIDMTTSTTQQFLEDGEVAAASAVQHAFALGAPITSVTMSSDGHASLPMFDKNNNFVSLEVGRIQSLYDSFVELAHMPDVGLVNSIKVVTSNPANALGLNAKGAISVKHDVDLLLIDNRTKKLDSVWSKGIRMIGNSEVLIKGIFE